MKNRTVKLGRHDSCLILRGNGSTDVDASAMTGQAAVAGATLVKLLALVAANKGLLDLAHAVVTGKAQVCEVQICQTDHDDDEAAESDRVWN